MLGWIIFAIALTALVAIAFYFINKKQKAVDSYRLRYEKALQSSDRQTALKYGREYYTYRNGGFITSSNEQSIANDLAAMK